MSETKITAYKPIYKKEVIDLFKSQPEIFAPDLVHLINKQLTNSRSLKFVYIDNFEVVGFISAAYPYDSDDIWEIGWIAVRKDLQNKGLGTKLLKFLENKIKSQKLKRIFLETVHEDKAVSIATNLFYEKNGYKEVGLIPNYWGKGIGKVLYYKDLN